MTMEDLKTELMKIHQQDEIVHNGYDKIIEHQKEHIRILENHIVALRGIIESYIKKSETLL